MSKDSYWFRHDSTAGRTLKMRRMAHLFGHEGKGLYWDVVEILRDQESYQFHADEGSLQLLCDLVGCKDEIRFLNWFKHCVSIGLFDVEDDVFNCPGLNSSMEFWDKQKANGSKGGRPKKTQTKPKRNPNHNPNETITVHTEQIEHNKTRQIFTPPSLSEIVDYAKEKNYHNFNANAFHAYYESNGWKVGKNKMKDWQAAVRGWHSRDSEKQSQTSTPDRKYKML